MSKVELISKTVGVGRYAELTNEEIIAAIARHGTIKEDNGKLVKYLMDHSHWSPLQHISFGFYIETRRSISAQIFRHRSLNGQEWCIHKDSLVTMLLPSGNTDRVSIETLYKRHTGDYKSRSNWNIRVWDEKSNLFVKSRVKEVFNTGIKPVYKMKLESGKEIVSTMNHKFLTRTADDVELSFKKLSEIEVGKTLIAENGIPAYQDYQTLKKAKEESLKYKTGVQGIANKYGVSYHTIRKWLMKNNLSFSRKETSSLFEVWNKMLPTEFQPNYGKTISEEVREKMSKKAKLNGQWSNKISHNTRGFRREVVDYWGKRRNKLVVERGDSCNECGQKFNNFIVDHIHQVRTHPELAYDETNIQLLCEKCNTKKGLTERTSHLIPHYSQVISIEYVGEEQTYDLEVEHNSHNYVANNIVTHNSLRYAEPLGFEEIDLRREHPTNRQSSTESFDPILEDLGEDMASQIISEHLQETERIYNSLIKAGVAKECARDILPLATKTTIHLTGSLRDILGFLNTRHTPEAQKEIRDIAYEIGLALEKELPNIMSKIDWKNGMFM